METLTKEHHALIITLLEKHQRRLESDLDFMNTTGFYGNEGSVLIVSGVMSELELVKDLLKSAELEILK